MENILDKQKKLEDSQVEENPSKDFDEMYVKTFGKLPDIKEEDTFENNATKIKYI